MTNPDSLPNPLQLHLFLSPNSSSAFQNTSNDYFMHRIAIDQFAVLGSLYDITKDDVIKKASMEVQSNTKQSLKPVRCFMIKGDTPEYEKLSDIVGINGELWLNLILNIKSPSGITALIDYPFLVDRDTRFICYYYSSQEKSLSNAYDSLKKYFPQNLSEVFATHIVTTITLGICVVIVLQLPSKNQSDFDYFINSICKQLIKNQFEITNNDIHLLDKIHLTKIYSNILDITNTTKLTDVCRKITNIKQYNIYHCPLEYGLRPIQCLYNSCPTQKDQYISLDRKFIDQLQSYLSALLLSIKPLIMPFDPPMELVLEEHHLKHKIKEVKELYSAHIKYIRQLVMEIRCGKTQQKTIDDILTNEQTEILHNKIKSLADYRNKLISKKDLIKFFNRKSINYFNVQQITINKQDDINHIIKKICKTNDEFIIFCSSDQLRGKKPSTWNDIYQNWIKKGEHNHKINRVYADFSYCEFNLSEMKIVSSYQIEENQNKTQRLSILPNSYMIPSSSEKDNPPTKKRCPDHLDSTSINYINVLLLGESGVGKSTFINAFINYLAFQNLDQAHSDKPIALIPVSFLMTIGDNFEECIVKFGNEDSNEDHHNSGQSVTQQCKSYVFNINNKIKLRLIDTPGMGDTRGIDQDDLNINHILSYINNLEHLNAICILLKPNESRLNIVFRSYFNHLFKFLGPNVRDNIVFCFTNTRPTFFAPGNTGPLLKSMINSHEIKTIPFAKLNTFCFDSESFRYLIALENGIQFDDYQEEEYKLSWTKSVSESTRMFKYICKTLKSCPQSQWRSIEHTYFQIKQLIRPLLETARNIYRNIILIKQQSSKSIIKLHPKFFLESSCICYSCQRFPKLYGDIWIMLDDLHIFKDKCNKCEHSLQKHVKVDYELQYEFSNDEHNQSFSELESILDRIKKAMKQFAHFFAEIFRNSDEIDPILSALNLIIAEEDSICKQQESNKLNSMLHVKLIDLKKEYEKIRRNSLSFRKNVDLNDIYNLIKDVYQIELINKQMNIIKQVHQKYIEQNEIQIPHKFNLN